MTTSTTATKSAVANYDADTTSQVIKAMQGVKNHADQVAAIIGLMLSTGKNKRSLTAKISNLSRDAENKITFYGVEKNTTKTGSKVESKAIKVQQIEKLIGGGVQLDSMEKCTKHDLDIILGALSMTEEEIADLNDDQAI
jgi:hypothetical protein